MDEKELHSAGAIVKHISPFHSIQSYVNEVAITQEFREQWVIPFYFHLIPKTEKWVDAFIKLKSRITKNVILQNLGDFNWRTRSTGSFFAAITNSSNLEDIIGTHLLKSELSNSGINYIHSLASFNTKKTIQVFNDYLDYYLTKPELHFDQKDVMIGLKYLDEINNTSFTIAHIENWNTYYFSSEEISIQRIRLALGTEFVPNDFEIQKTGVEIDTSNFHQSMKTLQRILNS